MSELLNFIDYLIICPNNNIEMENGGRMKFFEMIRKTTIVQRILIGGSIVWILWEPRGLVDFVEGLILIFIVWGLYWIITEFMKQRKNK